MEFKGFHGFIFPFLFFLLLLSFSSPSKSSRIKELLVELTETNKPFETLFSHNSTHNSTCDQALQSILNITGYDESELRMLDSCGKFGSGLITGNFHAYGTFDECLPIRVKSKNGIPSYSGQYVLASLKINLTHKSLLNNLNPISSLSSKIHSDYGIDWTSYNITSPIIQDILIGLTAQPLVIGLCVPSLCSVQEIEEKLNSYVSSQRELGFTIGANSYIEKEISLNCIEIFAIVILLVLLLLSFLGTLLEYFGSKSDFFAFFACFSFISNSSKLFKVNKGSNDIGCLNGIRSLSMIWVIVGHSWLTFSLINNSPNVFDKLDFYSQIPSLLIVSSRYAVDTFFLIGGFLLSYLLLTRLKACKGTFNPLALYLHRYIRLTPLYAFNILFLITGFVFIGNGPHWSLITNLSSVCKDNWWTNLLYINNIVNSDRICLEVSWYLASDFQLFLISPPLIWMTWKLKKFGIPFLFVILGVSCAIPGILTFLNDWPPLNTISIRSPSWIRDFYYQSYTRGPPYVFGLLFGSLLVKYPGVTKLSWRRHKFIISLGWILCIATLLSSTLALYPLIKVNVSCSSTKCYSIEVSTLYAAFGRLAWSISVSWLIYMCMSGYSGLINGFLSSSFFSLLNKLSYAMYLIHTHIIISYQASQKIPQYYSSYNMIVMTSGFILLTLTLSILISLLFEAPFIRLEKLVFGNQKTKNSSKTNE